MKREDPKTLEEAERNLAFLQKCYQHVFSPTNQTEEILLDLAKFCRAFETTFTADDRTHALLEGRREVWLRIMEFLKLDTTELYKLHIRTRR